MAVWYIYLHEYHKNEPSVGKYTVPYMDPMGFLFLVGMEGLRYSLDSLYKRPCPSFAHTCRC